MREIEAEINKLRGEADRRTEIPLTNFRGIELRDFPAEVARLALIIAEFQCDVLYRGQKEALAEFLPLDTMNWITCGNALRLDWMSICPPTGTGVKHHAEDLFHTPLEQAQIDFENEGGETYICGNPPYVGDKFQTDDQKSDLHFVSNGKKNAKAIDYIAGWFWKASAYIETEGSCAFVSTNSICQGVQVPIVWPEIFRKGQEIFFAHKGFYWSNNASNNANVICVIVGISQRSKRQKHIYWEGQRKAVENINAYLVDGPNIIIEKHPSPVSELPAMFAGNIPRDKGNFMLERYEKDALLDAYPEAQVLVRKILGSLEFINGIDRSCLWISDEHAPLALFVFSIVSSRVHIAWISVTAGRMKSDFRYSSGVCYNSFPLPKLTEKNKADLTRCAKDILLARETHFPATIADLYDSENMPADLREAHERNDEALERIYIGRRFRNDTERLEKLFELYTKMTAGQDATKKRKAGASA
jgi:hypothetical protein